MKHTLKNIVVNKMNGGHCHTYKLKLTYDYTTVIFKTATEVETKLVRVKFEANCNEEQTYDVDTNLQKITM